MTRREIGRVTVLTNPASGHGNAQHAAEKAIERVQQRGIDVVAIVGSDAEHARRLLRAAVDKGTDAVVVTGGDGVICDALQTLACTEIPLGIIPAGTGNDHAREFGLPTKDPVAAADVVADGWTETVDLGRIRDRTGVTKWFGTVAAAGFDSLVTDRANRMRWPRGRHLVEIDVAAIVDGGEQANQPDARRRVHHGDVESAVGMIGVGADQHSTAVAAGVTERSEGEVGDDFVSSVEHQPEGQ